MTSVCNTCLCVSQESFNVAKTAFRQFKMKVRSNLAITHTGPETLEEAVQDYVNRNVDLYDAPGMVSVCTWNYLHPYPAFSTPLTITCCGIISCLHVLL